MINLPFYKVLNLKIPTHIKYWLLHQNLLPKGFTQLEYIETRGYAYITTNIKGSAKWKLKAQATVSVSNSSRILVTRGTSAGHWFGCYSGKWSLGTGSNSTIDQMNLAEIEVDFQSTKAEAKVNNETIIRNTTSSGEANVYKLFDYPNGTQHFYFVGKLYYCKCYQSNKLVANFIPCKNKENIVGLYDTISNTFYQSEGESPFYE